jgi:catechol 2,3-dioxygenase-like lactoylglutathione lyase family enzyme
VTESPAAGARSLVLVTLVVRAYDEAIAFYRDKLGFVVIEDTYQAEQDKRWVVIAPAGERGARLLLGRATTPEQLAAVGNQTGGRVFMFLETDDFWRDFRAFEQRGVTFIRPPKDAPYGTVAVFADLYGNLWDLVQFSGR